MIADALLSLASSFAPRASADSGRVALEAAIWEDAFGGGMKTEAGIKVSHLGALKFAPVWQAVSMISGDLAGMTLNVYKVDEKDNREIDWKHPAQFLVSTMPNEETPAFEFWRRLIAQALLWQSSYAYIFRRGRNGDPIELVNLLPDRTMPKRDEQGKLFYATEVDGRMEPLLASEVLHIKGVSFENGRGCDLIDKARDAIGLALAAQGFLSKFFANGAQAGGVLTIPVTMKAEAQKNLEEGWAKKYTGKDNWFKTAILREGAEFHAVTIDAKSSEMHAVREDQVRDVARFFNLPPAKLGLQDSVSYNSAEQAQLNYLQSTLNAWRCSLVSECNAKLLTREQLRTATHYFEHNHTKLIELDVTTLNATLQIQRQNGVINANDWRKKINLPPRTDLGGDSYDNPNTTPGGQSTGKPGTEGDDSGGANDRADARNAALRLAHRELLTDVISRMSRRVGHDARSVAKNAQKFQAWLDAGASEHRKVFDDALRPAVNAWAVVSDSEAEPLLCGLSGKFFSLLLARLSPLIEPPNTASDLQANVERECSAFEQLAAVDALRLLGIETE